MPIRGSRTSVSSASLTTLPHRFGHLFRAAGMVPSYLRHHRINDSDAIGRLDDAVRCSQHLVHDPPVRPHSGAGELGALPQVLRSRLPPPKR
jgi:hypothetical protein